MEENDEDSLSLFRLSGMTKCHGVAVIMPSTGTFAVELFPAMHEHVNDQGNLSVYRVP
jgi:hypothetical protein